MTSTKHSIVCGMLTSLLSFKQPHGASGNVHAWVTGYLSDRKRVVLSVAVFDYMYDIDSRPF